jgi:hypothetical protein
MDVLLDAELMLEILHPVLQFGDVRFHRHVSLLVSRNPASGAEAAR